MAQTHAPESGPWPAQALRALNEHWWLRHGLFWLVDTGLVVLFFLYDLHSTPDVRVAAKDALLILLPHLLATYALLYGVLAWLGRPQRRGLFLALLAGWFPLSMAVEFAFRLFIFIPAHEGVASPLREYHVAITIGPYMLLLCTAGVAACLRLYRQWQQKNLANAQLTRENYQSELQLLKAQIHPHFLFNTLNNLYALTLRQSDQAPEVVERLAGLLQFVVEQGNAPQVELRAEVALLRNYIALEQLRYGPRLMLDFRAENLPATGQIAPLLLLPLVENAFKHGSAEQLGQAHIRIALAVEGQAFSCRIENSKNPTAPAATGAAGIGLRNVRQRLQLLYPHRHRLDIEAGDEWFTVRLALRLPAPALAVAWAQPEFEEAAPAPPAPRPEDAAAGTSYALAHRA